MGSLGDFAEDAMLNHMFNQVAYTSPVNVFLALNEGDPTDTGLGGTEPSGNGYARQPISFGAPAARQIAQDAIINFPQATGPWQTTQLDHYKIMSAVTGGDFLAHGALNTPITVVSGNTPSVGVGECTVLIKDLATKGTQNNLSDAAVTLMLNHLFRNIAWTPPATYLGYATAVLADNTTGSTVVEPSGNNYGRLLVNPNSGGAPRWGLPSGGVLNNIDALVMPIPSGSWGTVVAHFIATLGTLGDVLYYDNAIPDQLINANDTVRISSGQFAAAIS